MGNDSAYKNTQHVLKEQIENAYLPVAQTELKFHNSRTFYTDRTSNTPSPNVAEVTLDNSDTSNTAMLK